MSEKIEAFSFPFRKERKGSFASNHGGSPLATSMALQDNNKMLLTRTTPLMSTIPVVDLVSQLKIDLNLYTENRMKNYDRKKKQKSPFSEENTDNEDQVPEIVSFKGNYFLFDEYAMIANEGKTFHSNMYVNWRSDLLEYLSMFPDYPLVMPSEVYTIAEML